MQNFLKENIWKSVRNYMEVIEKIARYVKKKKKKSQKGMCDLFPVSLKCIA